MQASYTNLDACYNRITEIQQQSRHGIPSFWGMGLGLYRTRLRLGWNSLSKAFERNQTLVGNTLAIIFGVPFLSFLPSGVRWGVPIAMVMFTIYRVLKEYRIIRNSLTTPHIPLIVIVGKEKHVREEMEREVLEILSPLGFRPEDYERWWKLSREDYIIYKDDDLSRKMQEWEALVKKFRKAVDHIESRVRRDVVFHVFLNCPAALAVGLGASIDCLKKVVVYHYNVAREPVSELNGSLSGSYSYLPVVDLSGIPPHTLQQDRSVP